MNSTVSGEFKEIVQWVAVSVHRSFNTAIRFRGLGTYHLPASFSLHQREQFRERKFGFHCKPNFVLLGIKGFISNMNNQCGEDHDEATVDGFEVPKSPDSSYNNVYPGNEVEARDPPLVPPHLQRTLLSHPASRDTSGTLPAPQNVILNHLYIENREPPRSVVALGFTHRYRSKFVTVVLYKPVQRRGSSST